MSFCISKKNNNLKKERWTNNLADFSYYNLSPTFNYHYVNIVGIYHDHLFPDSVMTNISVCPLKVQIKSGDNNTVF